MTRFKESDIERELREIHQEIKNSTPSLIELKLRYHNANLAFNASLVEGKDTKRMLQAYMDASDAYHRAKYPQQYRDTKPTPKRN